MSKLTPTIMTMFAEMYGATDSNMDGSVLNLEFPDLISAADFARTKYVNENYMVTLETPKTQMSFCLPVQIQVYPVLGVSWYE